MTLDGGSFGRNDACVLCNTDRASWAGRSCQEVTPHGSEGEIAPTGRNWESPLRVEIGGRPYGSVASLRSAQDGRVDRSCSNRSAG